MRIFCPAILRTTLSATFFLSLIPCALRAQTLARPGWAGSGLSAEPWWRSAVFYRIIPAAFQDSDGDGKGDLPGIAQRTTYLQSLSIDAVVLQLPFDENGFDDLQSEATRRHIRLLVTLSAAEGETLVPHARQWLTRGAAGIWLQAPRGTGAEQLAAIVRSLRRLCDSFPGQRVLIEDTTADPAALPAPEAELVVRSIAADPHRLDAISLRLQLQQAQTVPTGSSPLIVLSAAANIPEEHDPQAMAVHKVLAAAILLSRGAAGFTAGQEIGDAIDPRDQHAMQWTPSNITRAPAPPPPKAAPPPPRRREDDYGPFVPYVPPTPARKSSVNQQPDLDALPGFTSNGSGAENIIAASPSVSVAAENLDPNSLLNFCRRLSQLHHENAALRSGPQTVLDHDAEKSVVWLRKAPPGARTAGTVVIAFNMSPNVAAINLGADFARLHLSPGNLAPLLTTSRNMQALQKTSALLLSAESVFAASVSH